MLVCHLCFFLCLFLFGLRQVSLAFLALLRRSAIADVFHCCASSLPLEAKDLAFPGLANFAMDLLAIGLRAMGLAIFDLGSHLCSFLGGTSFGGLRSCFLAAASLLRGARYLLVRLCFRCASTSFCGIVVRVVLRRWFQNLVCRQTAL